MLDEVDGTGWLTSQAVAIVPDWFVRQVRWIRRQLVGTGSSFLLTC